MKALAIIVVLVIVCLVLFIAGVIAPSRSRDIQAAVDELSKKGEAKGNRSGGRLGDATQTALEKARGAADASAEAGRTVNDKIAPD